MLDNNAGWMTGISGPSNAGTWPVDYDNQITRPVGRPPRVPRLKLCPSDVSIDSTIHIPLSYRIG